MIKRFIFVMLIALTGALITGCEKKPDKSQIVAEVNNYQVTIDDFKQEARMDLSGASKEQVLQDIVTKELLLQEAQKMNLDKDKHFMKEIENYWKQALIKRLINIKGDEFLAASKTSDGKAKMEKAQILLDRWINNLKNNASIIKYDEVLNGIKLKKSGDQDGGANEE